MKSLGPNTENIKAIFESKPTFQKPLYNAVNIELFTIGHNL